MFVTVEEAKQHLYVDFEVDDLQIAEMVEAAEATIENYINQPLANLTDDWGRIPHPLKMAIKIMVGNLYANRESVAFNAVPQRIPYSYEYLIQPYRKYRREESTE